MFSGLLSFPTTPDFFHFLLSFPLFRLLVFPYPFITTRRTPLIVSLLWSFHCLSTPPVSVSRFLVLDIIFHPVS
jgi:hypothetical protein